MKQNISLEMNILYFTLRGPGIIPGRHRPARVGARAIRGEREKVKKIRDGGYPGQRGGKENPGAVKRPGRGGKSTGTGALPDDRETRMRRAELEILSLLAESDELPWAIQMVLLKVLEVTGVSAGAFRLMGGENYSFLVQEGLPDNFHWETVQSMDEKGFLVRIKGEGTLQHCIIDWTARQEGGGGLVYQSEYGSILAPRAAEIPRDRGGPPLPGGIPVCRKCLRAGFQTIALVPLKAGPELIGVLYLHDRRPGLIGQQDLFFLESVLRPMAYALKNLQAQEQLKASYQEVQSLSLKVLQAYEEERARLARELHDEVGQALTSVKLDLQLLGQRLAGEAPALEGSLDRSIQLLKDTVGNVRRHIVFLRPPPLDEYGLLEVVQDMVGDFSHRTGVKVSLDCRGLSRRLPRDTETALFRCIQESLTNVARHAGARRVQVTLQQCRERVTTWVKDDGKGFDPGTLGRVSSQIGLQGMEERVTLLGGEFHIYSSPGGGTEVSISIPHRGL